MIEVGLSLATASEKRDAPEQQEKAENRRACGCKTFMSRKNDHSPKPHWDTPKRNSPKQGKATATIIYGIASSPKKQYMIKALSFQRLQFPNPFRRFPPTRTFVQDGTTGKDDVDDHLQKKNPDHS